jgi:hypothetical protein
MDPACGMPVMGAGAAVRHRPASDRVCTWLARPLRWIDTYGCVYVHGWFAKHLGADVMQIIYVAACTARTYYACCMQS